MSLEIFLNIIIISFLCIGIIYAIVLEQRLSSSKETTRHISLLMKQFYESAGKLQSDLLQLKQENLQAQADLKEQITQAELIRDEIKFLNTRHKSTESLAPKSTRTEGTTKHLSLEEQDILEVMKSLK